MHRGGEWLDGWFPAGDKGICCFKKLEISVLLNEWAWGHDAHAGRRGEVGWNGMSFVATVATLVSFLHFLHMFTILNVANLFLGITQKYSAPNWNELLPFLWLCRFCHWELYAPFISPHILYLIFVFTTTFIL